MIAATVDYTPDVTVTLESEGKELTVHLARGGEQFPWAACKGRVIIGPPRGKSQESLEWNADDFWVIDAFDESGEAVELDPHNYSRAVKAASRGPRGFHPVGEACDE